MKNWLWKFYYWPKLYKINLISFPTEIIKCPVWGHYYVKIKIRKFKSLKVFKSGTTCAGQIVEFTKKRKKLFTKKNLYFLSYKEIQGNFEIDS